MSNSKNSRRNFIATSAKAGVAVTVAASLPAVSVFAGNRQILSPSAFFTSFDQAPLPYAYNALEPHIDAQTMDIHYNKHAAAYSKNLKEAAQAEGVDINKPLEDVLGKISKFTPKMRNNGGGHYNHELFWKSMKAAGEGKPAGKLSAAIDNSF